MKSREWGQFLAKMEVDAVSAEELKAAAADVADDRRRQTAPVGLPATLRRAVVTAALGDMRADARPRRSAPRGIAAMMLLTVAVSTVVLWPAGRHSSASLSYADAIDLLRRSDQDPGQYGSALAVVYQIVRAGIGVLARAVAADVASGPSVAAAAALAELRLVHAGDRTAVVRRVPADFTDVLATVAPPTSRPVGLDEVAVIRVSITAGIAAIADMRSGDQNARAIRSRLLDRIARALR
ncbi:MAG: hypothetical protein IPK26_08645 [Planctomycetes bacterium]|nr:hypothetical protein [Planctomycetota bacterium]